MGLKRQIGFVVTLLVIALFLACSHSQNHITLAFRNNPTMFNVPAEFPSDDFFIGAEIRRLGSDMWLIHKIVDKENRECWHLFLRNDRPEAVGIAWYIGTIHKTWIYQDGMPVECTIEEINGVLAQYAMGSV